MNTLTFLYRFNRHVLPQVQQELAYRRAAAKEIPDPELRRQALDSIQNKTFHCEGGSVYVTAAPDYMRILVRLIVTFQTISDYLDNLCDRGTSLDPEDFSNLHEAMLDAVSPDRPLHDYYQVRRQTGEPYEDGGYLNRLVEACREQIRRLPSYPDVAAQITKWVGLYRDLQVHKHVHPDQRESRLLAWWQQHAAEYPELRWHEFAAATGSTLGVFALFLAATQPHVSRETIRVYEQAYFPWISAAHILLDYLIDLEEDKLGGDLNFIMYYEHPQEVRDRLLWIQRQAREAADRLSVFSTIHAIAVDGLAGLYLSDAKVNRQPQIDQLAKLLLHAASWRSRLFYKYGKLHRKGELQIQNPRTKKGNDV